MTADSQPWASSAFRNALMAMVRRRVPESDAEDVVQSALAEAMASTTRPEDPQALRKWIWGIARNKVADYHRRSRRETFDVPEVPASGHQGIEDLLRWAMRELPEGQDAEQTLQWLLREGDGEKLESIAAIDNVPAARVRQRVSRLRRHFRARWAAQVAALAALGIIVTLLALWLRDRSRVPAPPIAHDPVPSPRELALKHARGERDQALELCRKHEWQSCLDGLDRAVNEAPELGAEPAVQAARREATDALDAQRQRLFQAPTVTPRPSATAPAKSDKTPMHPKPTGTTSLGPVDSLSGVGMSSSGGGSGSGTGTRSKKK
jgi:RNA polymerase sigma factor (sigma-70 family)